MIPVVLAGGIGSRLSPLSSKNCPKQFLPLISEYSMLQETLLRLNGIKDLQGSIVVCNEQHKFIAVEQLAEINQIPQTIILEPERRNTAPAIAAAALVAVEQDKDALLLVLPADHVIEDITAFHQGLSTASAAAQKGQLVTFGVVPISPETGYGYIKVSKRYDAAQVTQSLLVERFVEKPDLTTAESYLASGNYFWNSGMFMFKASIYLDELEQHAQEMLSLCKQAHSGSNRDMDFVRLEHEAFVKIKGDSIDYAVMEKTDKAVVVPLDAGWHDIGSWPALIDVTCRMNKPV